jgi:hypothetical protein
MIDLMIDLRSDTCSRPTPSGPGALGRNLGPIFLPCSLPVPSASSHRFSL